MKILVFGRRSTLASYLLDTTSLGLGSIALSTLDVTNYQQLALGVGDVNVIINCAAINDDYTLRDANYRLMDSPTLMERRAYQVNTVGATKVAMLARTLGAYLIHVSCHTVMGNSGPYRNTDTPAPRDPLAVSKMLGERTVTSVMGRRPHAIVRLGWLYGLRYSGSYVRSASQSPRDLRVNDHVRGMPIHGIGAAHALTRVMYSWLERDPYTGVVNVGSTDEPTTWYDFLVNDFPRIEPEGKTYTRKRPETYGIIPEREWEADQGLGYLRAEMAGEWPPKKGTPRQ